MFIYFLWGGGGFSVFFFFFFFWGGGGGWGWFIVFFCWGGRGSVRGNNRYNVNALFSIIKATEISIECSTNLQVTGIEVAVKGYKSHT